jgi:PglZ domain
MVRLESLACEPHFLRFGPAAAGHDPLQAVQRRQGGPASAAGPRGSDFVLMHCFSIVPKLVKTPVDLLKVLLMTRYGSLHNLPYHQQPVMVHQIPRFLAVERGRNKLEKIALLVLDGLAFDQWLLLRKNLEACDKAWRFQKSTAFAWVATLTSVTRQSIFAAEPPLYYPDSLETTSKERAHWQRFWEDQGVHRAGVELVTNIDGVADPKLETALATPRLSVLGVVWNKVDNIMHGMQMQTAGMHNQVRLWASQGHLEQLAPKALEELRGCGRRAAGREGDTSPLIMT